MLNVHKKHKSLNLKHNYNILQQIIIKMSLFWWIFFEIIEVCIKKQIKNVNKTNFPQQKHFMFDFL